MVHRPEGRLAERAGELDHEVLDCQDDLVRVDLTGTVLLAEVGNGREQPLRVRMLRRREQGVCRCLLDDLSAVHHDDPVGHVGDNTHVVGDEHDGGAEPVAQRQQQLEDRGLDRDVESSRRLIGNDHVGITGNRHGNDDALLLTAGQLVRVVVDTPGGIGQPDHLQQLDRAGTGFLLGEVAVGPQTLDDLPTNGIDRVERGGRLLEDHRDLVTANWAELAVGHTQQLTVAELGRAPDRCGGGQQAKNSSRAHRLARSGLTDHSDDFAGSDVEVHSVDGVHHPGIGLERDREV